MKYKSNGSLLCSKTYTAYWIPFHIWNAKITDINIVLNTVPYAPVSKAKEKDVRDLFKFLSDSDVMWYEMIFNEHE